MNRILYAAARSSCKQTVDRIDRTVLYLLVDDAPERDASAIGDAERLYRR